MASLEVGDIEGHRVVYYCYQCHNAVAPLYPELNCPDCNGGFLEVFPQLFDSDGHSDILAQFEGSEASGDTDMQYENSLDVESVSDLLGHMHLYDSVYDDHFPSLSARSEIPPGFTTDDAVMDPFEWDRILSWFFENESAFINIARLPEEQIESIPVSLLKSDDMEGTSACSVCIDDFKLMEEVKILPCKHFFHKECISSWLRVRANCPVCRQTIKVDDQFKNVGMVLAVSDTTEILRESVNGPSDETSLVDDPIQSSSEIARDYSAHPNIGESASGSSGISSQRQRALNYTAYIPEGEQTSHNAHSSQYFPNTGRGEQAVPHVQPSEMSSCHRAQHARSRRTHSGRFPSDGRALRRSTFSLSGEHLQDQRFVPSLTDLLPNTRSSAYHDHSFQSHDSVNNDSSSLLHYQRNYIDNSFDDITNRHISSNSNSLEDLSSIVPVLSPNVVL